MKKALLIASIAALSSANVAAQTSPIQGYLGLNYTLATYEDEALPDELDFGVLVGKAGAQITPFLAAELRAGFGVADDSFSAPGERLEFEVDSLVGAYLVAGVPNESPIYPYVVAGFSRAELTASYSGSLGSFSESESESDFSYGVGANFAVNEQFSLNAEYMLYFDKDGAEITGLGLGGSFRF